MAADTILPAVRAAQAALSERLPVSPLIRPDAEIALRGRLYLKAENLMPTGSFKIRGATFKLSILPDEVRRRGVVAYSTGNHAKAVAKAALDEGISATIVMSPDAPADKIEAARAWGARLLVSESTSNARRDLAERIAQAEGLTIVPPYDDLDIIAGQGTIGLELLSQLATHEAISVYAAVGGGGLLAGVAAALKQAGRRITVVGVEPELESDAYASFNQGRIIAAEHGSESIADAIKVQALGSLTFPLIQAFVDRMEIVSETEILEAMKFAWATSRMCVEPSGAVAVAAAHRAARREPGAHVAIVGGGNIALPRYLDLLRKGLPTQLEVGDC